MGVGVGNTHTAHDKTPGRSITLATTHMSRCHPRATAKFVALGCTMAPEPTNSMASGGTNERTTAYEVAIAIVRSESGARECGGGLIDRVVLFFFL